MSRLNILQLGTLGVDMKSNPLLLSNKKLHAATNIVFDEGVIRTRPGIRYCSMGCTGQFQGAAEFRPQQGLSSQPLSDSASGIAVVVDGVLWFNGKAVSQELFKCKGDVNVFQAENYLILQNELSETYWWDGMTLTKSPGMQEQDWNDPEMPTVEIAFIPPVADIPTCASDGPQESGITVTGYVVDHDTELPIAGAAWNVYTNGILAYHGISDAAGSFSFHPIIRAYTYTATKNGYHPIQDVALIVNGSPIETTFEECYPPTLTITGNQSLTIRLMPVALFTPFIGLEIELSYDSVTQPCEYHRCDIAVFNIYGNGVLIGQVNLNNNVDGGSRSTTLTLTSEQSTAIAEASTDGETIVILAVCALTACHNGVGYLTVRNPDGVVLYSGCQGYVGIPINVNPAP